MAVQRNRGSALSLYKFGLALGKGRTAHAATSILLAFSLGVGLLVTLGGAPVLMGTTNFEISDEKKSKAGQT